ncbi:hypothetical protein CHS0354_037243 [Potamilus streckersoni]|uniref:Uncharacterized protein n=1 Tax=Potamilus streckersoni TaxID=2493646 RepID=A0AAE0W436_9BIVA|nr:hypothetical protein CHS0354_037243 [Potamilus streckersoni]
MQPRYMQDQIGKRQKWKDAQLRNIFYLPGDTSSALILIGINLVVGWKEGLPLNSVYFYLGSLLQPQRWPTSFITDLLTFVIT